MVRSIFSSVGDYMPTRDEGPTAVQPSHIPDQRECINDLFDTDETVWVLFLDGGRYDMFDQLVSEFVDGELRRVWNGGVGYTGDWAVRNLSGQYGNRGLFSWLALRDQQHVSYDGRSHFTIAPDISDDITVKQQLAALGYAESGEQTYNVSCENVNRAVRERRAALNGGVVRYLKPHPPFDGLEGLTTGSEKTANTKQALATGALDHERLTDAYRETYRTGFNAAQELVADLDGRVVITADHGTCLTCGQLFHGRHHDKHDHLCIVPWFEVDT